MGFFGKLLKVGLDVATSPIAVAKDIVTLGGVITEEESAVKRKAQQIEEDWDELREECDD